MDFVQAGYLVCTLFYTVIALSEAWSTRYLHSAGFLTKCGSFYCLVALSILIGALSLWFFDVVLLDRLIASDISPAGHARNFLLGLKAEPILKGVIVGLLTRGFLNISFVSLPIGTGVPVGPRLLLEGLEKPLFKRLFVEHFNAVSEAATQLLSGKTLTVKALQAALVKAVPKNMDDRAVVVAEIKATSDVQGVVVYGIQQMGKTWTTAAVNAA